MNAVTSIEAGLTRRGNARMFDWLCAIPFVSLAISHLGTIWGKEQYQYFPFVIAAVAVLWWQRRNDLVAWRMPGRRIAKVALCLASLSLVLVASLVWSPWLGAVSAVLGVGAVILHLYEHAAPRNIFGIWLLLWLLVPIPLNFDGNIVAQLQRLSSRVSSHVLDLCRINHLMSGNVLQVPDKKFFVDEACSGIVSIMSVIAAGAIYCVWQNRRALHVVLLLATGAGWAVLMNVARISSIAMAHEWFDLDLSSGMPHEALGLVLFACTFIAVMSTDQILQFALSEIDIDRIGTPSLRLNPFVQLFNSVVSTFGGDRALTPEHSVHTAGVATLPAWIPILCSLIAVVPLVTYQQRGLWSDGEVATRALALDGESLPEKIGAWSRKEFQAIHRSDQDEFGEYSKTFTYVHERTGAKAMVSLDFPYDGWHDLCVCYEGVGWKLQEREARVPKSGDDLVAWDYVSAAFGRTDKKAEANLMFSAISSEGELANAYGVLERESFWNRFIGRLRRRQMFQVQLWLPQEIDEATRPDSEALFIEVRRLFWQLLTAKQ